MGSAMTRTIHSFTRPPRTPLHRGRFRHQGLGGAERPATRALNPRANFRRTLRARLPWSARAAQDLPCARDSLPAVLKPSIRHARLLARGSDFPAPCRRRRPCAADVPSEPTTRRLLLQAAWHDEIGRAHTLPHRLPPRRRVHSHETLARSGRPARRSPLPRSTAAPYYGAQAHLAVIDPLDDEWADVLTYADLPPAGTAAGRPWPRGSPTCAGTRAVAHRYLPRSGSSATCCWSSRLAVIPGAPSAPF